MDITWTTLVPGRWKTDGTQARPRPPEIVISEWIRFPITKSCISGLRFVMYKKLKMIGISYLLGDERFFTQKKSEKVKHYQRKNACQQEGSICILCAKTQATYSWFCYRETNCIPSYQLNVSEGRGLLSSTFHTNLLDPLLIPPLSATWTWLAATLFCKKLN